MNGPESLFEGIAVGAVPYLNVEPLVRGLHGVRALRPSDLASALDRGEVDLATLPVGALVGRPDLVALPSVGIGADGPVRTVLLEPLEGIEKAMSFRPDPASRSSNLLAALVLRHRLGREVPPDPSAPGPRVVIGDPAFAVAPERALDLAEAWKEWTDLPFVFALWVAGPRLASDPARLRAIDDALASRVAENLADLDTICRQQDVVEPSVAREYLSHHIRHVLDDRFRAGAERFAAELREQDRHLGGIRWAC
jgi:chorismate dehydratase